ncbi:endonuclease [Leucobacter muris]|uniref:Endonuclease n=1 Tax=Leucobacter muris TaxID=1935379 RepID=A0ABX5QEP7_9MICO|nr:endonuclease [Leucobacter muris]QAB17473.1 endonuclease [Leucobacter muris]
MATPAHNANGHRRRELTKRVKAEETHCALCDKPVDKTLTYTSGEHGPKCSRLDCKGCIPHPMRGEVDEDLPRSRGGSPYDRKNCRLMHRDCNNWKGKRTIAEARAKLHGETLAPLPKPRPLGSY